MLLPWAGASWPKRTAVADVTRLEAHPLGAALPLRALLTKTPKPAGQTDVSVKYRLEVNGAGGLVRSMLLTSQGARRVDQQQGMNASESGELYERLFEPSALLAAGASRDAQLVYWFETSDDRTEERRILLVEPPAIRSASVSVDPPAYAVGKLREGSAFVQGSRDAGHGVDQRSMVGPILAGSRVKLTLELNKPLAGPANNRPESLAAFVAAATPGLVGAKELTGSFAPTAWTFEWTLESSRQVAVNLIDEHKIRAVDDAVFRFEATADRAPTVLVVDPAQDEAVLPTAVIPAAAEARDAAQTARDAGAHEGGAAQRRQPDLVTVQRPNVSAMPHQHNRRQDQRRHYQPPRRDHQRRCAFLLCEADEDRRGRGS